LTLVFSVSLSIWVETSMAAPCVLQVPEEVVVCLETSIESRDIAALENLLAPDFTFQAGGEHSWGKDMEINAYRKMFADPKVEQLEVVLSAPVVVSGEEPGTWSLEQIDVELRIHVLDDGGISHEYTVTHEDAVLRVRAVETDPGFQIVSWEVKAE